MTGNSKIVYLYIEKKNDCVRLLSYCFANNRYNNNKGSNIYDLKYSKKCMRICTDDIKVYMRLNQSKLHCKVYEKYCVILAPIDFDFSRLIKF